MKPVDGKITTGFFENRPLDVIEKLKKESLTLEERKSLEDQVHVHGAIDIGAPVGAHLVAPEDGDAFAWAAFRNTAGVVWPETVRIAGVVFPFNNYFYDTYGTIIVLRSADGRRTHIMAHVYLNQAFNKDVYKKTYVYEEKKSTRFPLHAFYTNPIIVRAGDLVGFVGDAGLSTGAHVHWEIHHGYKWNWWDRRINPGQWEA